MESQPSKKHDRRFSKRHRTEATAPAFIEASQEPWFPKFLVIHSEDQALSLAKVSPFLVAKTLEQSIGKSYNAKKLVTGDIQVEVFNKQQSTALQLLNKIGETSVTVSSHRTLNTVKGVISVEELLPCSDSEIEEGLKHLGVITARRIIMRREGKEMPTRHIVLSFKLHSLPSTIKAGYINCHVRPYVPNPRRCFKCQRFGHSSQSCRGKPVCPKCAGVDHSQESCSNEPKCVNCQGSHPVYSRSCLRWKEEKEILKIKTEQNITYKAAKAQLDFSKKGSFAEVVRRGVAPLRKSVETQTSGTPPHTPHLHETDTEVSSHSSLVASQKEVAATPGDVAASTSIWEGASASSSQNPTQSMELDDDDCASQKSTSSLPSLSSQGKERRESHLGRGRAKKLAEAQKAPPKRVLPP